jgi:hypothetical protein
MNEVDETYSTHGETRYSIKFLAENVKGRDSFKHLRPGVIKNVS